MKDMLPMIFVVKRLNNLQQKMFEKNKKILQTKKKIPAQTLQSNPVKFRENIEQNTDQSPQANENSAKAISKPWKPC